MSDSVIAWQPPLAAMDDGRTFPVRHFWCVGRNYTEHAREMGADPERESPVFFSKPATALVSAGEVVYPAATEDCHHEVELAVCLAAGGSNLAASAWRERILGYAVAVDLTRRDVQAAAKRAGHPWEMAKGFDQSAPLGAIVPATRWQPDSSRGIDLEVNGTRRQAAVLGDMIWCVEELLARLSAQVTLHAGDVILTGTPAGVGPVQVGDQVRASIDGLPVCQFRMVEPKRA